MANEKSSVLKRVFIILGITIGAIITVAILFAVIFPQTQKRFAGSMPGGPEFFYKSDLKEITGRDLKEDETDFRGIKCTRLKYTGSVAETDFDYLRFYLFKDGKTAYKAFNSAKGNNWAEGENSIWGYEEGVMDADVFHYYYLSGNLIVELTRAYSNFYDASDPPLYTSSYDPIRDRVIKIIPRSFSKGIK